MKSYLVGRHGNIDFPTNITLVGKEVVTFPATAEECGPVLAEIAGRAVAAGAEWLLFVGMPGQVVAALSPWPRAEDGQLMTWREPQPRRLGGLRLGVVISKPGPRPAGVETRIQVPPYDSTWGSMAEDAVVTAVTAANPNAKIEVVYDYTTGAATTVIVRCDPPMKFEFSHIEEM